MYYPFLRGKQYELILLREIAGFLSQCNVLPIVEPVKESVKGLQRSLKEMDDNQAEVIVIVNPSVGDLCGHGNKIEAVIAEYRGGAHIHVGIMLDSDLSANEAYALSNRFDGFEVFYIHHGFNEPEELIALLADDLPETKHIFMPKSGKLYRRKFKSAYRVYMSEGFERQSNRKYDDSEFFSDLHVTYDDEGLDGFGDFLIVGSGYSESGGPAYAIAIHITYINTQKDDEMHVYHFKSTRNQTPADPAGKFKEALDRLVENVQKADSNIYSSHAVEDFIALKERGHFPGLGFVKKLSMKHHIETIANYLNRH